MRGVCAFDRGEFMKSADWLRKGVALASASPRSSWGLPSRASLSHSSR